MSCDKSRRDGAGTWWATQLTPCCRPRRVPQPATGTMVLKVQDGLIVKEIGLDDGVSVLRQLGLVRQG